MSWRNEMDGPCVKGEMKTLVWVWAVAVMMGVAAAQEMKPQADGVYQMRVDSHLIDITALVRNAKGEPVTGLAQEAFHVREDGAPQNIRYFASQRQLPLSVGLIVDASDSQEKFVKEHEKEIESFLREVMEPRDHAFAVCFGNHLRLTTDWSNDAAAIVGSVHRFNKGDRSGAELGPKYTDKQQRVLGTALYDAVYFPIEEKLLAERGRRRVLIVFSDGEENSSEHDLVDAISAAQSADTLVYAVRTTENKPKDFTARDLYGMRVLEHLTEATGGRSFDARAMEAKKIFASIATDLKSLYEIGYYSSNTENGFRKVRVTVEGAGLKVQSRAGYVAR